MTLHRIDAVDVGGRLRGAREATGLTQADVAADLRVARTTLVAMEQGRRRVRTDDLQRLARLYCMSVNALLRCEAVHVDLVPRSRKLWTTNDESMERAARLMTDLVRAEVELENLLGVARARNYPPARPMLAGDVRLQAENDAIELRQWLGLGLAPVRDVLSLLELDLGVRLYVRRLDSRVSGLCAYDDGVGACILLNASHSPARQAQTAVRELGHLTSRRHAGRLSLRPAGRFPRAAVRRCVRARVPHAFADGQGEVRGPYCGSISHHAAARHPAGPRLRGVTRGNRAAARGAPARKGRYVGSVRGQRRNHRRTGTSGSGPDGHRRLRHG